MIKMSKLLHRQNDEDKIPKQKPAAMFQIDGQASNVIWKHM
jgi:hypothetical protein